MTEGEGMLSLWSSQNLPPMRKNDGLSWFCYENAGCYHQHWRVWKARSWPLIRDTDFQASCRIWDTDVQASCLIRDTDVQASSLIWDTDFQASCLIRNTDFQASCLIRDTDFQASSHTGYWFSGKFSYGILIFRLDVKVFSSGTYISLHFAVKRVKSSLTSKFLIIYSDSQMTIVTSTKCMFTVGSSFRNSPALSSQPRLPVLLSDKLSIWLPCGAVLTGGIHNGSSLDSSIHINLICLTAASISHPQWALLMLKILFRKSTRVMSLMP